MDFSGIKDIKFPESDNFKFSEYKKVKKPGYEGVQYSANGPIGVDAIIRIVASYEGEDAVLYECKCRTFNDEGRTRNHSFRSIDQLGKMHDFPNPSIGVHAIYVDPRTNEYRFDISTALNTRIVGFSVSDKVSQYVRKSVEREAAERKRRESK